MERVLLVEEPYMGIQEYPWDGRTKERFALDSDETELLELGEIVWRGQTAYSLGEQEEVTE